jgi:hypothetical protein
MANIVRPHLARAELAADGEQTWREIMPQAAAGTGSAKSVAALAG